MIEAAKECARRSILIDNCTSTDLDFVQDSNSIDQVYTIERETRRGLSSLTLVEFKDEDSANRVAASAKHVDGLLPVPLKVLRYCSGVKMNVAQGRTLNFPVEHTCLSNKREVSPFINSYEDLATNNMMSLAALKMRFITLVNLESILCSGIFSAYELMPFGSSVIDLGSDFGDLDIVLTQRRDHQQYINNCLSNSNSNSSQPESRNNSRLHSNLVHLDKSLFSENRDRGGLKGTMRWFDYVLKEYMPLTDGFSVLSVRHAKVPIIKFTARVAAIDCDLSFNLGLDHLDDELFTTNYSGILMSQILYTLCRSSSIFTPVSVYLRLFAKLTSITSKEPNIGMTNFQYLSLILFYLQRVAIVRDEHTPDGLKVLFTRGRSKGLTPLIPPFKDLLDPTYQLPTSDLVTEFNEAALHQVLAGFFQFYSDLDFTRNALNLYEAKIEKKLDNSCVYINNPLDRSRNICHNVNRSGLDHFVRQVRTALRGMKASKSQNPLTLIRFLLHKDNQHQHQQSKKLRLLTFDGSNYDLQTGVGVMSEHVAEDVCR